MSETGNGKVVINGRVFLYGEKAPFVASGASVHGALEFREDRQQVRCHECGRWFKTLARHIRLHDLNAAEYKRRHGLRQKTALCSEDYRSVRLSIALHHNTGQRLIPMRLGESMRGTRRVGKGVMGPRAEKRNTEGICQAQVLSKLRDFAGKLNRTPTSEEIRDRLGLHPSSLAWLFNVRTYNEVITLAGLEPRKPGVSVRSIKGHCKFAKEDLIEILRDFYVKHGRLPNRTDMRRGICPRHRTFEQVFDSWAGALSEAGLGSVARRPRTCECGMCSTCYKRNWAASSRRKTA